MTRISQDQIDLGSETALDLLVKSNEDKATLAATLTNKGTAANPDTETWSALLTKTADLNVEAGRALLDVPIVSRTISSLGPTGYDNLAIGVAWGRWMFYWQSGTTGLGRIDLKNNIILPNYDTSVNGSPSAESITVTGVSRAEWYCQQLYVKNNQLVMTNTTTLTVYDVDEETGVLSVNKTITLGSTISAKGSLCGSDDALSKFLFYDADGAPASGAHSNFKFILAADGSVNAASSVPTGTSRHICPAVYDNDLVFSSTQPYPDNDTALVTVKHFLIDWDTLAITDTGYTFFCNGSATYANNREVLTSTTTGKRYIPYHNNATSLYCLDDGVSTKISEKCGKCSITYNMASSPTVTHLSDGGHVIISNYGFPIFLEEDLTLRYEGVNYIQTSLLKATTIATNSGFRVEQQIYDEATQTLYAFYSSYSAIIAKFHVYLNKVAGYSRLHNGVTTPFWAETTDADIAAGALDKAEVV